MSNVLEEQMKAALNKTFMTNETGTPTSYEYAEVAIRVAKIYALEQQIELLEGTQRILLSKEDKLIIDQQLSALHHQLKALKDGKE